MNCMKPCGEILNNRRKKSSKGKFLHSKILTHQIHSDHKIQIKERDNIRLMTLTRTVMQFHKTLLQVKHGVQSCLLLIHNHWFKHSRVLSKVQPKNKPEKVQSRLSKSNNLSKTEERLSSLRVKLPRHCQKERNLWVE